MRSCVGDLMCNISTVAHCSLALSDVALQHVPRAWSSDGAGDTGALVISLSHFPALSQSEWSEEGGNDVRGHS